MLSIPKYPEQYAQHFPTIFYLLCCASQHHVMPKMETGGQSNPEIPVSGKVGMAAIEWPAVAQQRPVEVRDKAIAEG